MGAAEQYAVGATGQYSPTLSTKTLPATPPPANITLLLGHNHLDPPVRLLQLYVKYDLHSVTEDVIKANRMCPLFQQLL